MHYFDFDKIKHHAEIAEVFLMVALVYLVIFSVSWVYNRLGR
jgi:hypothetical protein